MLDTPSMLCRKLSSGELDVALVSSFEFLRNPIYFIVDGVSISSDGPVYSVGVAHRNEVTDIEEIELDPTSETSVNLLRCLLARRHFNPRIVAKASSSDCARLLIGDQAIRFRQSNPEFAFWDLGEEWSRLVGRPFVFALWLMRPELPKAKQIAERLRTLRDDNVGKIEHLIAEEKQFDREFCRRYFRDNVRFTFGEREKQGFHAFGEACASLRLIGKPPPEFHLM